MATDQLREVAHAAAWSTTVAGSSRSAIVLTTCDLRCLKMLFEPWMWSIENNRDGDFSMHVVVVGNGHAAHAHCEQLRQRHKHRCVLDRMCAPPRPPAPPQAEEAPASASFGLGNPMYFLALLQKVRWAQAVLQLRLAVMWTDMDIFFFSNPLRFMFDVDPDADLVIQTEYWNSHHMFKGDACKFAPYAAGCKQPQPPGGPHPLCCGMQINGGLWLAHPRPPGRQLLRLWEAFIFRDSVVQGKAWDKSAVLDQYLLERILGNQVRSAPLYAWDAVQQRYVEDGATAWDPTAAVVYRTSGQRTQSRCFGECGWRGPNVGFRFHTLCRGERKEGALCFGPPGAEAEDPGPGTQLVCAMPGRQRARLVSVHQNCAADVGYKRLAMLHWRNWTVDEAGYEAAAAADPEQRVVPEW